MRYKLLGRSGLRVSEIILGTMTFGTDWGWGSSYEESRKIFDVYAQAGGNFLDTANMYTKGTSEKYVGEFVKGQRDSWVIGTKYSLKNNENPTVNQAGNHRKNMVQSLESSLKRLQMDYVDLLWLHCWDYTTPVEEVMRGLDDLVRAGKVLYVGVSDTPAWVISQANTLASLSGWSPFIAIQVEYSLKVRDPERDLIPMARSFNLGVTAWGPLAAGLLTGKYNKTQEEGKTYRLNEDGTQVTEHDLRIAQTVLDIAKEVGHTPAQVAINWLVQQGYNLFPIIGARKTEQLKDSLGYDSFKLTGEQMQRLSQVSQIKLGDPYDFFNNKIVQEFAFGNTLKQIDHR